MTLFPLVVALALAADKPPPRDTMKDLVKDVAGAAKTEDPKADAKDAKKDTEHPDVTRLPFTPDSIKQVVLSYQPKIQSCYEETLAAKDKAVEGQLKTAWIITGDGMVKGAKVDKKKSSLKDPRLHDCVVAVLSTMAFPKPPDAKDHPIEFPFNLKAVH